VAARLKWLAAAMALAVVLTGCMAPSGSGPPPNPRAVTTFPSPQLILSAQIAETVAALRTHLGAAYPLVQLSAAYRPSEPESMQQVPRAALQVDLGAPGENYVVVYELTDTATAAARGRDIARYLGSGFGQTNYPPDAQFALSQFGSTLVFAWWSPARSSSAERARGAFELIGRFGQPIPVLK
jgi:hypothetical protein